MPLTGRYEARHDVKPAVQYFRMSGYVAYAKITRPHTDKIDD